MRKPNILLITSDQQHYNTLGICNPEIRTPNLDRLAREGTLFTRAYCTNPTSTPSRASIITGLYPSQHGAWSLGTKLPEEIPTLGGYLEKAGYQTALVGKAHFQPKASSPSYPSLESDPLLYDSSFWEAYHGPFYGFRHVELLRNHTCEYLVGQHYALWLEKQYPGKWKKYFLPPTGTRSSDRLYQWDIPEKYHYNTWITERCCSLLDGFCRDKTPFFLWASFPDPHPPYLAPSPWCDRYAGAPLTLPRGCPGEFENLPPHFAMTRQENADWSSYGESGQFLHGLRSHSHITGEQARRNMEVYYGMISYLDSCAGMLLERLDELGMRENTLVVFTTDHGHLFGQHGLYYKEELAACGIGMHSSCHRQNAFGMFQIIGHAVSSEFTLDAVAGAAHTGAIGTSALDHETADDTVEDQTIVKMLVDQIDEIVNGFGCNFGIKLAFDHTAILHGNSNNRILCHNNFLSSFFNRNRIKYKYYCNGFPGKRKEENCRRWIF